MKYSFVLPAYKATFLREAIDSILNQTYKDFELIIVNDASPEDLTSIVNSYQDERIQYYVNEKNVGGTDLVAQWNHCITYAIGEYLILASDDDVYHPDYLEKMDVLVDKYPKVNIFRPRVEYIDSNSNLIKMIDPHGRDMSQLEYTLLLRRNEISSGIPFYIFRRSLLMNMGGFINFPLAWFSDDATAIRLSKDGIVLHDDVLFSFRMSGVNISSTRSNYTSLLKKLSATDSFYNWLADEAKTIVGLKEHEELDPSRLNRSRLGHMIWLICRSRRRVMLFSWFILGKIKSLKSSERLFICRRVFSSWFFNLPPYRNN